MCVCASHQITKISGFDQQAAADRISKSLHTHTHTEKAHTYINSVSLSSATTLATMRMRTPWQNHIHYVCCRRHSHTHISRTYCTQCNRLQCDDPVKPHKRKGNRTKKNPNKKKTPKNVMLRHCIHVFGPHYNNKNYMKSCTENVLARAKDRQGEREGNIHSEKSEKRFRESSDNRNLIKTQFKHFNEISFLRTNCSTPNIHVPQNIQNKLYLIYLFTCYICICHTTHHQSTRALRTTHENKLYCFLFSFFVCMQQRCIFDDVGGGGVSAKRRN